MLTDTDVLIWYMRGHEGAAHFIDGIRSFCVSAVTYMELIQGMRDKREFQALRKALKAWGAPVLPLTESITSRAITYVERHWLSHRVRLADALVAATAVDHGLPLATANEKHYRVIAEVVVHLFEP